MKMTQVIMKKIALSAIFAAAMLQSLIVAAEPTIEERALATALFEEGRTLLQAGRASEACPKFERAHKIDPSGGTILNLALCYEQLGLTGSAWAAFNEALATATRDNRKERATAAQDHLNSLRPKLSRIRVVLAPAVSPPAGFLVQLDTVELPLEALNVGVPVDPGSHSIRASAPNFQTYSTKINIKDPGEVRIEIPGLTPVMTNVTPAAQPSSSYTAKPIASDVPIVSSHKTASVSTRTWVLGGTTLGLVALASTSGILALSARSNATDACPTKQLCSQSAIDDNNRSLVFADVSTVLFVAGAIGGGLTVWSFFSDRATVNTAASKSGVFTSVSVGF